MGADYKKAQKTPISGGSNDNQAAGATEYYFPSGVAASNAFISPRRGPFAVPGILEHLYVRAEAAPGVGETFAYAIFLNGVVTLLATQIAGGAAVRASDLVNQIPIVAGDELTIEVITSVASAVTRHFWGFVLRH